MDEPPAETERDDELGTLKAVAPGEALGRMGNPVEVLIQRVRQIMSA